MRMDGAVGWMVWKKELETVFRSESAGYKMYCSRTNPMAWFPEMEAREKSQEGATAVFVSQRACLYLEEGTVCGSEETGEGRGRGL